MTTATATVPSATSASSKRQRCRSPQSIGVVALVFCLGLVLNCLLMGERSLLPQRSSSSSALSATSLSKRDGHDNDDELVIESTDAIYQTGGCIVVAKYKLIFFYTPKVACTAFKQLLRRMSGQETTYMDLQTTHVNNGLTGLRSYSPENVTSMIQDPTWTKAVFVRDPKERAVSAYLDKIIAHPEHSRRNCCQHSLPGASATLRRKVRQMIHCGAPQTAPRPGDRTPRPATEMTFKEFITEYYPTCRSDEHWYPQTPRIDMKVWPYINFIGYLDNKYDDTRRLLEKLGVWEKYGANGWYTPDRAIFQGDSIAPHTTDAARHLREHFTSAEVEAAAERIYAADYSNPYVTFSQKKIYEGR